jgi:hypothetical protein
MDHVAVDLAGASRDGVPGLAARRPLGHPAAGAHRPRRVAQRPALPAPLDPQFPGRGPGPEERGVRRYLRPHHRGCSGRDRPFLRAELEDPEVHGRHRLIPRVPGGAGGHEPALTERGPLGAGDVNQAGPHPHLLTVPQVAVVDLVAVGSDDRGVPGLVERQGHRAERVVVSAAAPQPRHRPDLNHGRRSHQRPVDGGGRESRVGVHRAAVADRLDPVADHREVHRVAA